MLDRFVLDSAVTPDCALIGGASVFIATTDIAEVALIELSLGQVVGRMGLGHQSVDPGLVALEDLRR
jgi:hypothetical protein